MPVTLGSGPLADFDQPLQLLQDCHRRIEHFLGVLRRVAEAASPLDDQKRSALETALRYFREAAPRHTADEEQSLFPRLRQNPDAQAQAALAMIEALEADHVAAQKLHERVDTLGRQWLASGTLSATSLAELQNILKQLQSLYEGHIRVEDEQVFPAAAKALQADALAAVGREMKARRTQNPGREGGHCAQRRQTLQNASVSEP